MEKALGEILEKADQEKEIQKLRENKDRIGRELQEYKRIAEEFEVSAKDEISQLKKNIELQKAEWEAIFNTLEFQKRTWETKLQERGRESGD